MDLGGLLTSLVVSAFCLFIGYLKGYEDGQKDR